ncbi:hypothetical protein K458DRAFT_482592 [Lentithecium fluviatile CBS 122367]|uniref:Uncharacterized protein n=1 Tax=Lentithecium fluviatile CBS 122367 TaxID=1168545 RepID=A0A6G1JN16_9PLEO|nr:hypothetical protein K458DRAFT_482592 [Lentithecium fluviatile CBS 122367]
MSSAIPIMPTPSHVAIKLGGVDKLQKVLRSAIFEILMGHEPFLDLDELDDEEEIEKRYTDGRFPALDRVLGEQIVYNCWSLAYSHVDACAEELRALGDRVIELSWLSHVLFRPRRNVSKLVLMAAPNSTTMH